MSYLRNATFPFPFFYISVPHLPRSNTALTITIVQIICVLIHLIIPYTTQYRTQFIKKSLELIIKLIYLIYLVPFLIHLALAHVRCHLTKIFFYKATISFINKILLLFLQFFFYFFSLMVLLLKGNGSFQSIKVCNMLLSLNHCSCCIRLQ